MQALRPVYTVPRTLRVNVKIVTILYIIYTLQVAEYFVGDGPNNRYALICKQCAGHNGMALAEEFVFVGWYFS